MFKRSLVQRVAVTIAALSNFVPLLKSVLLLIVKFRFVCISMCSLVMNPFSRDFIKVHLD